MKITLTLEDNPGGKTFHGEMVYDPSFLGSDIKHLHETSAAFRAAMAIAETLHGGARMVKVDHGDGTKSVLKGGEEEKKEKN